MSDQQAAAFAALQAIQSGEWDRYLVRLQAAIYSRRRTQDYHDHIVAGVVDEAIPTTKEEQDG